MKKVIVLVLSLIMVFALVACAPAAVEPADEPADDVADDAADDVADDATDDAADDMSLEGKKIAYFVSELSNEFHQARAEAAVKYAMDEYGIIVDIIDGKSDASVMTQNVDMLATSDYMGASLQIWEADAATPGVEAAIEAGVAMTSFFSPLGTTGIPTFRSDEYGSSFEMGAEAAKQWVAANPDKPIVTVQLGWPDHTEVKSGRTDPWVEGIESVVGAGNYTNLGCLDSKGSADATKEALAAVLVSNPEVNLIYSEAGNLTPGAMAALIDAGRGTMADGVPTTEIVASVDLPTSELTDIYNPNSSLKMSMGLPPIGTSKTIIDTIVAVYLGEMAQVSDPAEEAFGPTFSCIYWTVTLDETLAWYNEQFGTSLTADDVM
jgi:ABC-type sugar transport system substrate-binding protein